MEKAKAVELKNEVEKLASNYSAIVDAAVDGVERSISYLMELHGVESIEEIFRELLGNPEGEPEYFANWGSALKNAKKLVSDRQKERKGSRSGPGPTLKKTMPTAR